MEGRLPRRAAALTSEIQGVHQWITFAVNTPIQMAYAEAVRRDPDCRDITAFYQGRRDKFLALTQASRFRPLTCEGTFFQMFDYSEITRRARRGLRHPAHA